MTDAQVVWFVMGAGVIAYALTAGADFGGGVLHLFARGPDKNDRRRAIESAIAPIWEANHVWLIFVIVMLFTAFPSAFSVISTALHIPIGLALLGIVIRGSAFVFFSYDLRGREHGRAWATAFGASSLFTPFMLGDTLGALSTGDIRWNGVHVTTGFVAGWTTPFSLATGAFTTALFTLLAAVYMTAETAGTVRAQFRKMAVALELAAAALALCVFLIARRGAPAVYEGLAGSSFAVPIHVATGVAALCALGLLLTERYRLARVAAATQVALVVVGWGLSMGDAIVMPDVTLHNAGTRAVVVNALLPALAVGAAVLVPSLWYLFRVFKAR